MVTEATSDGLILASSNIEVRASLIPALGFVVVGALCLLQMLACISRPGTSISSNIDTYHATTPLPGSDAFVGSRITPSVLVLEIGRLTEIRGVMLLDVPANINTNPKYSVHLLMFE